MPFNNDRNRTVCWAPDQHIRMISKGSCDTEDWSNGTQEPIAFFVIISNTFLKCNINVLLYV